MSCANRLLQDIDRADRDLARGQRRDGLLVDVVDQPVGEIEGQHGLHVLAGAATTLMVSFSRSNEGNCNVVGGRIAGASGDRYARTLEIRDDGYRLARLAAPSDSKASMCRVPTARRRSARSACFGLGRTAVVACRPSTAAAPWYCTCSSRSGRGWGDCRPGRTFIVVMSPWRDDRPGAAGADGNGSRQSPCRAA